jgi:class 3 adenylate cyclase
VDEPFTLEGFVALHPWDPGVLDQGRPLEWLFHYDLECQPDEVWKILADTSRFNRALGLSRMQFAEKDGVLHGEGTNGGVRHVWREVPWDWVAERWLIARRVYSKGFPRYVRVIYRLQRLDRERVRVWVYYGWIARGTVGKLALKFGMPSMEKGYRKVLDEVLAAQRKGAPAPAYFVPPPELAPPARERLRTARAALTGMGISATVVDALLDHVASGDDLDVYRIQLRKLARHKQIDERQLLGAALHATRLGVLEMSWDVICPHCRGVRDTPKTLGDVPARGSCDVCEVDFDTSGEHALEITFHVHSSIREVPRLYFCSAEPAKKAHIELQQTLQPGEQRRLDTALGPGRYRLRLHGQKEYAYVDVAEGAPAAELAWAAAAPAPGGALAPHPTLVLHNDAGDATSFTIEDVAWSDEALRPVDLFNFQEFRDLFSDEYVGSDIQLSVGEQTILFTDIVGSTRFYATRGDPGAFMEVRRHFTEVFEVVKQNNGAVVKTIGDAAMASFSNPVDALRAARDIHARFPATRTDTPIRLRASLNTGPCIAVRLNANIDYFGNTVNTAAKLQACCGAGEIAFSEATRRAPGVDQLLAADRVELATVDFESKALGGKIPVYRWDTNAAGGGARREGTG